MPHHNTYFLILSWFYQGTPFQKFFGPFSAASGAQDPNFWIPLIALRILGFFSASPPQFTPPTKRWSLTSNVTPTPMKFKNKWCQDPVWLTPCYLGQIVMLLFWPSYLIKGSVRYFFWPRSVVKNCWSTKGAVNRESLGSPGREDRMFRRLTCRLGAFFVVVIIT